MSSRTVLRPEIVIPSAYASPANTGSMAANITSMPTILQSLSRVSYSVSWAGSSPVGTIQIQCSNDYAIGATGTVVNSGTWNTMTVSLNGSPVQTIPVTGNSGSGLIDITATAAYAVRLVYTFTSGTGTLQAIVTGKV